MKCSCFDCVCKYSYQITDNKAQLPSVHGFNKPETNRHYARYTDTNLRQLSWLEQDPYKVKVHGSSPCRRTIFMSVACPGLSIQLLVRIKTIFKRMVLDPFKYLKL